MYFDFCNKKIVDFETFLFVFDTKKNGMMIYDDDLWSCPLRGHYRRRFAPPRHVDLLQKNIFIKSEDLRILGSENFGERDLIWRPPKNTLLLWMVFIGFYFLWISQKLQYFFNVFWFLQQKMIDFEVFFCVISFFYMWCWKWPSGALAALRAAMLIYYKWYIWYVM